MDKNLHLRPMNAREIEFVRERGEAKIIHKVRIIILEEDNLAINIYH